MPKRLSLNIQILLGAVLGIIGGLVVHQLPAESSLSKTTLSICSIASEIFIDLLKMVLIPLIFISISSGIANLQAHNRMHRVWITTLIYFICSSLLAILLGLISVNIFKPGQGLTIDLFQDSAVKMTGASMSVGQFAQSFLSNLFMNPIAAMANTEVLPTVIFALLFGIALLAIHERTQSVRKLLNETFDIIMVLVDWIMKLAPVGVMALLLKMIATQNVALLKSLATFVGVVVGTTLVHGFIVLPLILWIFTRTRPLFFFKNMRDSMITAFSTSSSSATMPVTLRCVQENLKVDKHIAGFVVPLGTTINMDGTAMYEAIAALFIANLAGIELNLIQQLIVFFTSMLASIGAPGIPSAGFVTMAMVLQSVGLPVEAIAILLPIDRPLDALRTMVNVEGDAVGSLIVQKFTTAPKTSSTI